MPKKTWITLIDISNFFIKADYQFVQSVPRNISYAGTISYADDMYVTYWYHDFSKHHQKF